MAVWSMNYDNEQHVAFNLVAWAWAPGVVYPLVYFSFHSVTELYTEELCI